MAVLFLPTVSPETGQAPRRFGLPRAVVPSPAGNQAAKAVIPVCLSVSPEMCGQVPEQLCFPGSFQLFFCRVGEPGLEEASACLCLSAWKEQFLISLLGEGGVILCR